MKTTLFLLFTFAFILTASAQSDTTLLKRSFRNGAAIPAFQKKVLNPPSLRQEVTDSLQRILFRYASAPDVATTWSRIRLEMDNYLHGLWTAGRLQGVKADQAYYVEMGASTMTANDIAQHRKIAVAGFAPVKPAEFIVVRLVQ